MTISVVFLPGIMGSTLFDGATKIWPRYRLIIRGTSSSLADRFMDPSYQLDPKGLIQDNEMARVFGKPEINGYTKTRKFFQNHGFTILEKKTGWTIPTNSPADKLFFEYPYDWRKDLRTTADLLHEFIRDIVSARGSNPEIHLVGHSMGGLLSRTYLMKRPNERSKIKKQIFIGTPNHGAPKAYVALRDGTGLLSTGKIARNFPKDLHILARNLPGIYQLLPDERYQGYFFDYGTLVKVGSTREERSIRGTYIAGDPSSTIYPNSPNEALAHYALSNNNLVNDSLAFRSNELGRQTFLPDKTYAIYSTELETINGLEYKATPGGKGTYRVLPNSDGTVTERSVYDLVQLVDDLDNTIPNPKYTRRFSTLSHTELQWKRIVLRCVLGLIFD
jgi:pimeloyl-ACP methyl ester carboxylesterase